MDRITKNLLDDFLQDQGIKSVDEPEDFEKFCSFCVLSKEYSETLDIFDVWSGKGNDTGIDGIAIIVNGRLVNSEEEVEEILTLNGYLDVIFIFIQAKTGNSFDGSDIGNFFFGVKDFFSPTPKLVRTDFISEKAAISDCIFQKSAKMTRKLPSCKLYFVTTGSWQNDTNLSGRIETEKQDIKSKGLFDEVNFSPIGAAEIRKMYNATKERASVEINFTKRVTLPELDEVNQSYIGTLPLSEYFKLIVDESGSIRKPLFYDNIRDFQGDNAVNKEIAETLEATPNSAKRFVILNNGITVVAKSLITVGDRFTLRDYQIVNGCQTSHVLYNLKDKIDPEIHVPIKIIATTDENTTNSVIKSTNRQTEVKTEELTAMSEFQKRLEAYYNTYRDSNRLYYERRSKQYNGEPNVEKVRVITIPTQIRVFASMFLDLPHRAGRYYGTLKEQIGKEIFAESHELIPYYASAVAYYRGEYLFRSNTIDPLYKKFRYHTLMIL